MVVGMLTVELHLPAAQSLKDKRSVLKRLLHRLCGTHNLAAAELDLQDVWRRAVLGAVTLSNSRQVVENTLRQALHEIDRTDGCEVIEHQLDWL